MNQFFRCFCINRFGLGPLHYLSSVPILASNSRRYSYSKIDSPHRWVGESTRLLGVSIFFKPLNNAIAILNYIPGLFFVKLVLYRHGLAIKSPENRHQINFSLNSDSSNHQSAESSTPRLNNMQSRRLSVSLIRGIGDSPTHRYGESATHRITGAGSRRLSVS